MDFAAPVEYSVKMKESEKIDKYLDLYSDDDDPLKLVHLERSPN